MSVSTSEIDIYANYPTIEPSLKLDFANSKALDPRITFTRASVATYVGGDGLIKTAGNNEPRFDHDPATGESLGLLIEESRSNLFEYSEDFTNADWAKFDVSISSNSIIAPDGSTNSYTITEGTANAQHNITDTTTVTGTKTFSVYAKLASGSRLFRIVDFNATDGAVTGRFDLSNGTIDAGSDSSAIIKDCGNGWYRCSITTTTTVASNYYISLCQSDSTFTYTGDGSSSFYIFGAQLEAGSFPTSYIPTSGSTVTRAQDEGNITGGAFSSFFNTTEGVLQTEFSRIGSVNNQMVIQFKDSNASERIEIRGQGSSDDSFRIEVIENGATTGQEYTFSSGAVVANVVGQFAKVNLAYKQNDFASTINGTIAKTDNSGDVGVCDRAGIGYANYGVRYNGHIKNIIYYPKRLTNTQLQSLTGIPTPPPSGEAIYTAGSYSWTAPDEVTSVSVVAVGGGGGGYGDQGGGGGGLGWKNNIPVVPGQSYTVEVGNFGNRSPYADCDGGDTYFISPTTVKGGGGIGGGSSTNATYPVPSAGDGTGGDYVGDGGGTGGQGGGGTGTGGGGGGGAGGYSGDGGDGGQPGADGQNGSGGAGGGGGGGGTQGFPNYAIGGSGGGVGLLGEGASGTGGVFVLGASTGGTGGSGGNDGQIGGSVGNCALSTGNNDHLYGGGGASGGNGNCSKRGAPGALRIVWGPAASFP